MDGSMDRLIHRVAVGLIDGSIPRFLFEARFCVPHLLRIRKKDFVLELDNGIGCGFAFSFTVEGLSVPAMEKEPRSTNLSQITSSSPGNSYPLSGIDLYGKH